MLMNYKKHHLGKSVEEESFSLIAIHTSIEDFQLAYFINQSCATQFKRDHDLYSSHLKRNVNGLIWKNSWDEETYWHLFPNKYVDEKSSSQQANLLFEEDYFIEQYVLPEFKQVNYFIKKPEDTTNSLFIKKIQELPEVQIAYSIAEKAIKSTKNIIFD
tara:strand:- start:116 stop:592 length:477 start_codon:yes stop_codon:yes gene_type:complete